ncbi:MAG: flagellar biosynthesis anti-sigma factor FlgM [Clostridia bacterium]|jgi:negative regulator of flagellin synthesis FlgM
MKINPADITKIINAYKAHEKAGQRAVKPPNAMEKTDKVELSPQGLSKQAALAAAKAGEDIRDAKVQSIRERIRKGTYQVDAGAVADKILEHISFDKKI